MCLKNAVESTTSDHCADFSRNFGDTPSAKNQRSNHSRYNSTVFFRLKKIILPLLSLSCCCFFHKAEAYIITGVSNFSFGTISSPFPTLTMTDSNVCVSEELLDLSTNYHVTVTSSGGGTTAFLLTNTSNPSYTLAYSVFWASPSTFVALSPNTPTLFGGAHLFLNPCPTTPNVQLRIQILSSDQMLAKQGTYSDTLTILVAA